MVNGQIRKKKTNFHLVEALSMTGVDIGAAVVLVDPCQEVRIFVDRVQDFFRHQEEVDVDCNDYVFRPDKRMSKSEHPA